MAVAEFEKIKRERIRVEVSLDIIRLVIDVVFIVINNQNKEYYKAPIYLL